MSRALGARRTVLAVPVAPADWTENLADVADELIALHTPSPFFAVGQWYERFAQTTDEEVLRILRDHDRGAHADRAAGRRAARGARARVRRPRRGSRAVGANR